MNQQTKTKRPFPYVTVCLIAIVALIAVVLLFSLLDSVGVVGRLDTAVKSDNYTVSGNELAVYEYQAGLSSLANQFWYYQYGLMQDPTGVSKLYANAYDYAYAMLPAYVGTGAFSDTAYAYAQQYVVYCEGALAAGVTLDEEDLEELETYMKDLETTAKSGDMSLRTFIKTYIGPGITEKEVRSAMEKYYLGIKYAEIKNEEFEDATTDKEMEDFREDNKASFYKNHYHSYVLVNESLKDKAAECDTVEEMKELLANYMVDKHFEGHYKSKITEAKDKIEDPNGQETTKQMVLETILANLGLTKPAAEATAEDAEDDKTEDDKKEDNSYTKHFTGSDTDAYKKAAYQIVTAILSATTTETNKISQDASTAYIDLSDETASKNATDVQKWLFGEGRKVGDKNVVKTTKTSTGSDGKETTTTTYTWCVVTKVMAIDEEKTKDAYYVTLNDDKKETETGKESETTATNTEIKTGEQKAKEFFEALEAAKTTDKFDELAVKFGAISEGGTALKESISQKSVATVLGDWLYAEGRKEGDIAKLNSGSTYYIVYFVEENEETWKVNARAGVASEKLNDWYEEMVEKYNVEVDTKAPETENHEGHDHD